MTSLNTSPVTGLLNRQITLSFSSKAAPSVAPDGVTWTFAGSPLDLTDERYTFSQDRFQLTIVDLRENDAGTYRVTGANRLDQDFAEVTVIINSECELFSLFPLPPLTPSSPLSLSLLPKHNYLPSLLPIVEPVITQSPANMEVVTPQVVTLRCSAQARPLPQYTWTFNGKTVTASNSTYTLSGGDLSFTVVNVTENGTYTCTARNIHNFATTSAQLSIQGNQQQALEIAMSP